MSGLFSIAPNSFTFVDSTGTQNARIYSSENDVITVEGTTPTCVIAGVASPTANDHAATKKYVDESAAGILPDGSVTNVKLFTGPTVTANKCDTDDVVVTTSVPQSKSGAFSITDATQSTNAGEGCLTLAGGLGVEKNIFSNGSVTATAHITLSDKRMKSGITQLTDPGEVLKGVNVYSYTLKHDPSGRIRYGVLAQEVHELPGLADCVIEQSGVKTVNYTDFVALLIGSVNALQDRVKALEKYVSDNNK